MSSLSDFRSSSSLPAPLAGLASIGATGGITFAPNGAVLPYTSGSVRFGLSQVGGSATLHYEPGGLMCTLEFFAE